MSIVLQDLSPKQIPLALDANHIAFWQLFFREVPFSVYYSIEQKTALLPLLFYHPNAFLPASSA